MNKLSLAAAIAGVLAVLASAAFAGNIVVEAEHYKTIASSMTKITDSHASAGAAIGIPLRRPHATTETGPGDTGNATYKIRVNSAGLYQFWARAKWYDACGNSFFVLLDSTRVNPKTPYVTDQTFRKWHWVAGPTMRLSAGVHTIRIQNREDGAQLDQWLLTTRPKKHWVPVRPQTETKDAIVH